MLSSASAAGLQVQIAQRLLAAEVINRTPRWLAGSPCDDHCCHLRVSWSVCAAGMLELEA